MPKVAPARRLIQAMESEYAQNFHAAGKPLGYGFARVPSEAALFYDAVQASWPQAIGARRTATGS